MPHPKGAKAVPHLAVLNTLTARVRDSLWGMVTASSVSVSVMTQEAIKITGCIDSASELGIWAKIVALVRNFIKNQIPEGYQDENGFHFGVKHAD